jgi:hypothetical protein
MQITLDYGGMLRSAPDAATTASYIAPIIRNAN